MCELRYRFCRKLEEGSFAGKTADFVLMLLFGSLVTLVSMATVRLPLSLYVIILQSSTVECKTSKFKIMNHACKCKIFQTSTIDSNLVYFTPVLVIGKFRDVATF